MTFYRFLEDGVEARDRVAVRPTDNRWWWYRRVEENFVAERPVFSQFAARFPEWIHLGNMVEDPSMDHPDVDGL